jgi:hypothetical protein
LCSFPKSIWIDFLYMFKEKNDFNWICELCINFPYFQWANTQNDVLGRISHWWCLNQFKASYKYTHVTQDITVIICIVDWTKSNHCMDSRSNFFALCIQDLLIYMLHTVFSNEDSNCARKHSSLSIHSILVDPKSFLPQTLNVHNTLGINGFN